MDALLFYCACATAILLYSAPAYAINWGLVALYRLSILGAILAAVYIVLFFCRSGRADPRRTHLLQLAGGGAVLVVGAIGIDLLLLGKSVFFNVVCCLASCMASAAPAYNLPTVARERSMRVMPPIGIPVITLLNGVLWIVRNTVYAARDNIDCYLVVASGVAAICALVQLLLHAVLFWTPAPPPTGIREPFINNEGSSHGDHSDDGGDGNRTTVEHSQNDGGDGEDSQEDGADGEDSQDGGDGEDSQGGYEADSDASDDHHHGEPGDAESEYVVHVAASSDEEVVDQLQQPKAVVEGHGVGAPADQQPPPVQQQQQQQPKAVVEGHGVGAPADQQPPPVQQQQQQPKAVVEGHGVGAPADQQPPPVQQQQQQPKAVVEGHGVGAPADQQPPPVQQQQQPEAVEGHGVDDPADAAV